jgi:fructokinase
LANIIYTLSPQRIILGGGIMKQATLLPLIRRNVLSVLNTYLEVPAITERINEYIVPPALGDKAGVLGAIVLASFQ